MQRNQAGPKTISDADVAQLDKSEELKYRDGHFQPNLLSSALTKNSQKHKRKTLHCQHCDYATTNSGHLKVHTRIHTGDMLHCKHCDYTTNQSGHLKAHSRKHTGERLQCEHCDYTTTRSDLLKAHSRKHTGE